MDTVTRQRNIQVELDPVDALQTSLLLKEIEDAHTELDAMRRGLLRTLRKAIDASLDERYPLAESEQRLMDGNR